MKPVRIAVDVDEVLCPFVKTMSRWKYPSGPPNVAAKHPYNYATMFGITQRESKKMVDSFYFSNDFKLMRPFTESQLHLQRLHSCGYDLYCVTGRQSIARDTTEEWISTHYPGLWVGVYENILANTPGGGPSLTCNWIRGHDEFINQDPW